jgi:hypothetical protein
VNETADLAARRAAPNSRVNSKCAHTQGRAERWRPPAERPGVLGAPFATHGEEPPGVTTPRELKGLVRYEFAKTPRGGQVVVTSTNVRAPSANHDFLRYQIREHATGDPITIRK